MQLSLLSLGLVAACADAFMAPATAPKSSALKMSEAAAPAAEEAAPKAPPAPKAFSKSLPFLLKPKNLDGLVGNAEFDPLGFATYFPVDYLVESEIKHGRVAMLAVVGWFASELFHLPGDAYQSSNPLEAITAVGPSPMLQIFFGLGALEFILHKGKMTMEDMHSDGHVPGDFGWYGPMKNNSKEQMAKYRLNEIKNGRLAMLAIGHLILVSNATGTPTTLF